MELNTDHVVVGRGSYNCAVATPRGVIRFASLNKVNAWTRRALMRGAALIHYFNRHPTLLGPSLVKETVAAYESKDLPYNVCSEFRKDPGPFYVHGIEYLDGGHAPDPADSPKHVAFPLVWFLYVAQRQFNFRHGDLKPGNIVFRRYENGTRFTYRWNDRRTYSFFSRAVPVIIDYDFGGVFVTNAPDRRQMGTYYTIPPEVLIARALDQPVPEYDDWWSLGIVLFEYWTNVRVFQYYEKEYEAWLGILNKGNRPWLRGIFDAFMIFRIIHEDPLPFFPRYAPFYRGEALAHLMSIGRLGINIPHVYQINLLRQLLSWEPRERGGPSLFDHFTETENRYLTPDFYYNDDAGRNVARAEMDAIDELKERVFT